MMGREQGNVVFEFDECIKLDAALAVLRGYEAWEAKLVLDNDWSGANGMPVLTQADYDGLIELQTQRNAVLKGETK